MSVLRIALQPLHQLVVAVRLRAFDEDASREGVVLLGAIWERIFETGINFHEEDGVLGDLANAGMLRKQGIPTLRIKDELEAVVILVLITRAHAKVGVGVGRRDLDGYYLYAGAIRREGENGIPSACARGAEWTWHG